MLSIEIANTIVKYVEWRERKDLLALIVYRQYHPVLFFASMDWVFEYNYNDFLWIESTTRC